MSHWKKFESEALKDTNKELLNVALREMGVSLDMNTHSIRNSYGNETVDAALMKDGKVLSLGLNFKVVNGAETVEVTGDFWNTGLNESTFIDKLSQAYQKHNIVRKCEEQGWNLIDDSMTTVNGEIYFEVEQYA